MVRVGYRAENITRNQDSPKASTKRQHQPFDVMAACSYHLFPSPGCRRDKDGYYWITGRIDDMLNVSVTYLKRIKDILLIMGTVRIGKFPSSCIFSGVFPSGHLLSTAEVESALVEHKAVAEAAVVSRPHSVKGESLYCFITLNDGVPYNQTLEAELRKQG
ncbi:hypothetical protein XENOCAPTIV_009061 [Xenoophorus captivus]|uniref:AMP-binding enzyme C-terminal domain-containing protein n=1 Tax=Xenoophorus captivus TaxID=1517983 RepID=A0ABV0QI71_9TELE